MLKQKIQADFITAMKAKDEKTKLALSGLKAKITEAEKNKGNNELSDDRKNELFDSLTQYFTAPVSLDEERIYELLSVTREEIAECLI